MYHTKGCVIVVNFLCVISAMTAVISEMMHRRLTMMPLISLRGRTEERVIGGISIDCVIALPRKNVSLRRGL